MSVWGRRGSYSATTFVVVFFVGVASIAHLSEPYINRSTNPDLASSHSDFVREARHHKIDWHEWNPETLALARRLDRPLLIFYGSVWGELRPKFDSFANDADISEQMNREFICVRIDALIHPAWRSGPLQLERSMRRDSAAFGIAIFAPEGTLIALPGNQELVAMNDRAMLTFLRRSLNTYAGRNIPQIHDLAIRDAFSLTGGITGTPAEAADYAARLAQMIDPQNGGFRGRLEHELMPAEYEVMLDFELVDPVELSLSRIIRGSIHDALWGGYFERWSGTEPRVTFAKTAFSNAAMLNVLARLAVVTEQDIYADLARQQFDYVADRFAMPDSPVYEFAEFQDAYRSPRHSFSPRRLAQSVPEESLEFVREALGLNVRHNPQATPYLTDPEEYFRNPRPVESALEQMRSRVVQKPDYIGRYRSYEAQAQSIAAMLRTARLLNDSNRAARASTQFDELRTQMRAGVNDVLASPPVQPGSAAGLGAYLAYASAAWEMLCLTGDSDIGRDGLMVLDRARFLFSDGEGGIVSTENAELGSEWGRILGPEVLDLYGPSAVAEFIRLSSLYTRWSLNSSESRDLRHSSHVMIQRTGWILDPVFLRAGTLAHALAAEESGLVIRVPQGEWATAVRTFPRAILIPGNEWSRLRAGRWVNYPNLAALQDSR